MKKHILAFILCLNLIISMSFGVLAESVTGSGTSTTTYNYTTIYPNNQLNQNVIDRFNSMTPEEKANLLPILTPLYFRSLGIYTNDAYDRVNDLYNRSLEAFMQEYPTAQDLQDSDEAYSIKKAYTYLSRGHGYYYYENFDDYLGQNIVEDGGVLVLSDTSTIYDLYNDVIKEEKDENGIVTTEICSAYSINASNFYNVGRYASFKRICRENEGKGFIFVNKYDSGQQNSIVILSQKPNIYNNGNEMTTNSIRVCDDNGQNSFIVTHYYASYGATDFTVETLNSRVKFAYATNTGLTPVSQSGFGYGGDYVINSKFSIYTLNASDTEYNLFTSLNGWINSQGQYIPSYQIGNNYGTVPSAVVTSNQMTTYYNNTYTDNSVNGSNNVVYYPPNYDPNSNGYDNESKTLSFDGISNFLSSLGNLIGSLINGIAQGLANLIESLISIVNNLRNNLMSGVIFEFLSMFLGWLPVEIVSLLTALFAVTVIFALIKLLKGFF